MKLWFRSVDAVCLPALILMACGMAAQSRPIITRPPMRLPSSSPAATVTALKIEPASLLLSGQRATARYIVTATLADGTRRDVTGKAPPTLSAPTLASMDADGTLHPRKDGSTTLMVSFGGKSATAKVLIKNTAIALPVRFNSEVVPILTRYGCNQGSCHGAQYGKGGFKLSLAGFDTALDYQNIAKQARSRRIALAEPTRSLLLTKPAMQVPHGGGRRLEANTPDYKILVQWLRDGAPGPDDTEPYITKVEVFPSETILQKGGEPQRLVVRAAYSDGTTRDVTAQSRLNTLNDAVATCTPEGLVRPVNKGQTAIMVRYSGMATVATMIVPFRKLPAEKAFRPANETVPAKLDRLVAQKQQQLGLAPSPLCDDTTFIRRVSLDLIGTLPTPQEIDAFLTDKSSDRRARLIDSLLNRPEYADFWTLKWGDLLRSNRGPLGAKGMWSFTNWIRSQFLQNRPADQFVRDLITAQGSTYTNGPSNFFRVASNPQDLAETTSQVFLGVRLQCARCHQHPFEKWSQTDYYQFAAYFARVGTKGSNEFGLFGGEQVVRINDGGEVYHPKSGKQMYPTPLGLRLATLKDGKMPDPDTEGDRRQALGEWLVGKNNRLFARNIANRYWGYLLGRGIVNPIDDMRVTNPPSNPALLDALADELVRGNYDLKNLLRTICNTQTYQRSAEATPENRNDEIFLTHYMPRRLSAEVLLDAIDMACGTREKYPELPLGTRAIQLPDPAVGSDFLDTFGRPARLIACECERMPEPNLSQTLRLMNGELINRKVGQGDGRIAKRIAEKKSDTTILNELYRITLGRLPRSRERTLVLGALAFTADRKAVFEDVLLTLLNSKEFLFTR